jgi:hypothetical protein
MKELATATKVGQTARTIYLNRMGGGFGFIANPYLQEEVFRECFATAAHQYNVFYHRGTLVRTQQEEDDRQQYIRLYRHARRMTLRAVHLLKENEENRRVPAAPKPVATPVQFELRLDLGPTAAVKERLRRLRDEMAARPLIR